MTLPVHFVRTYWTLRLCICLVTLQAYVPAVILPDICSFASNVTRVRDEINDVTSVNTVLQQCNGK